MYTEGTGDRVEGADLPRLGDPVSHLGILRCLPQWTSPSSEQPSDSTTALLIHSKYEATEREDKT